MKSQSQIPEADDSTVVENCSGAHERSANAESDQGRHKKKDVEKVDQSLKLWKSLDDTFLRDESTKKDESSTKYNAPTDGNHELEQTTSSFPSTMKKVASEPSKYQRFNTGSRSVRHSERHRL